jgi:predicted AlkP superfamily pyrophosphatase or phosphodiesterase
MLARRFRSSRVAALAVAILLAGAPRLAALTPPPLLVVVSVDQLPRRYLDRFGPYFGEDGFKRLLKGGADWVHCHHGHATTLTGPGHAVLLSGAYPAQTGIVGNRWYSRAERRIVGCVEDERHPVYGAVADASGAVAGVSPRALETTTLGDVLRAGSGMRSKVISLSLKDRAAVPMGGRRPNAAYWLDMETCRFTTSSYYLERLPGWVERFNTAGPCDRYLGKKWTKLRAALDYTSFAGEDNAPYEGGRGAGRTFPHALDTVTAVVASPFGNEVLLRLADEAIEAEELGSDADADVLAIGFSTNDYLGHLFGPRSQEVADATLRTDLVLADLMDHLDRDVGAGRWTLVLTSDHGVGPAPEDLERLGILSARADHHRFSVARARPAVENALSRRFFGAWSEQTHPFVYVRAEAASQTSLSAGALLDAVGTAIAGLDGVGRVYTRSEWDALGASRDPTPLAVHRAWHPRNGGDLFVQLEPYWIVGNATASHGSPYEYDTHVPLILYGAGIRGGRFTRPVSVADLAPTLAALLGIEAPPESQGRALSEALR